MHEIHASIVIRLDDAEAKEWTSALSVVASQWAAFLAAVEPLHGIAAFSVTENKTKAANGVRRRHRAGKAQPDAATLAAVS